MMSEDYFFDELYKRLHILSSPYKDQIAYVDSLGNVSVDELGLELDDNWLPIKYKIESTPSMKKFHEALCTLDSTFGSMNNKEELWTKEALKEKSEWENIRNLARKCLKVFPDKENHSIS